MPSPRPAPASNSLDVLGTRARLVGDARVVQQAANHWAPFARRGGGSEAEATYRLEEDRLEIDGEAATADTTPALVLARLAEDLNHRAVASCPHYAVHAGVIRAADRTIAWPATSGAGKSTLTAACMQAGAVYVSDEALCLGYDDGLVRPYPKPIALDGWSLSALGLPGLQAGEVERLVTAADLGASVATEPAPLTDLVLLDRRPAGPPELVELPRTHAVSVLLEMSFNHYKRPADSVELVARLARGLRVWRLGYADPASAATRLLGHLL